MRKSNNYKKFLEYIAFGVGGNHGDAVCTDNGVLECVAEARVEGIEGYSKLFNCKYGKMAMDSDTWLKFKVVLVNEDVIEVYYVTDSYETHIDTFVLDNFRTQKEVLSTVHQKVVEFFLNSDRFCKLEETSETEESTEDSAEYDEILDRKESTDRDRINYLMETHSFPSIPDMYNDKCFCCPADRPGNRCCGEKWCAETWKRYESIIKPEWHHVSLTTLANLDFDKLDKKRQVYLKAHRELKRTLADLSKCKTVRTYEARARKFFRVIKLQYYCNEISHEMHKYLDLQISMSNVINGVWSSYVEPATGMHESRRYSRTTLAY